MQVCLLVILFSLRWYFFLHLKKKLTTSTGKKKLRIKYDRITSIFLNPIDEHALIKMSI